MKKTACHSICYQYDRNSFLAETEGDWSDSTAGKSGFYSQKLNQFHVISICPDYVPHE